jgi:hypothetical protein
MSDDLSVAVERLRTSTQHLNSICDAAAKVIRDVESFLEECHVGVSAYVEMHRVDETGMGHYSIEGLSYNRYNGKFRICTYYVPCDASGPEDEVERPWSESSRDEKLGSLEFLPQLIVEIAKNVEERKDKAEKAINAVTAFLQLPNPTKRKGS